MLSAFRLRHTAVGVLIATLAALYRIALGSSLTNDDFSHLTLSRQLLGGDLPVRDFVESGITLTYGLSAASQLLFGHRLLAEAVIVAIAFFVSTYAVFALVRTLTGSTIAAVFAALLLPLAGPRGYSYPKIVVYAVAAVLWWSYARKPSRLAAGALGAWAALAFLWRPDHGVYVAAGVLLAMVGTHGFRLQTLSRTALSGATAITMVLPFFLFVASIQSVPSYVRDGFGEAQTIHTKMDSHAWPRWPINHLADVARFAPASEFAPVVLVQWAEGATPDARADVFARHHLASVEEDGDRATRVRLGDTGTKAILALINDPAISDTAGIDRSSASIPLSLWPPWERVRFRYGWLRLRVFPALDDLNAAGEAAATLFYLLPAFALLLAAAPLRQRLALPVTPIAIVAFSGFAAVVNVGILRTPYGLRAADGVVMPAILLGCLIGVALNLAARGGRASRIGLSAASAVVVLFLVTAMATVGQFGERISSLAGEWRSALARGERPDMVSRLVASPPLRYWDSAANAPVSIRFAQYAAACVPPSERIAVLWYAPELYYYSNRLMAIRHLVFAPGLASPDEQRRTAEKFTRTSPPVVFAGALMSTITRPVFPELIADVDRDYVQAGSLDDDEGYFLFVRRDRTPTGTWGPRAWPCFAP
jgi:hypothetical protein